MSIFMNARVVTLFGAVAVISACSGGGSSGGFPEEGGTALCQTIAESNPKAAFAATNCSSCTSAMDAQSIDKNFDTKATMTFPNLQAGTIELRATAQSGIVYPAGLQVGAVYGLNGSGQLDMTLSIVTYLAGAQQEQYQIVTSGSGGGSGERTKTTFTSKKPYDAVAVSYNRAGGSAATVDVYEFCAQR